MCGIGSRPRLISNEFKKLVSLDMSVDYYVIGHTTSVHAYTLAKNHIRDVDGYYSDVHVKEDPEMEDSDGYYNCVFVPMIDLSKKLQMLIFTKTEGRRHIRYIQQSESIWHSSCIDQYYQSCLYEKYLETLGIEPNEEDKKIFATHDNRNKQTKYISLVIDPMYECINNIYKTPDEFLATSYKSVVMYMDCIRSIIFKFVEELKRKDKKCESLQNSLDKVTCIDMTLTNKNIETLTNTISDSITISDSTTLLTEISTDKSEHFDQQT